MGFLELIFGERDWGRSSSGSVVSSHSPLTDEQMNCLLVTGKCVIDEFVYVGMGNAKQRRFGLLVRAFDEPWIREFPKFPFHLYRSLAFREDGLNERLQWVVMPSEDDFNIVKAAVAIANKQIEEARNFATFPRFTIPTPSPDPFENIPPGDSCFIRCVPFTAKTKRHSKHPFELNVKRGLTKGSVSAKVSMTEDGRIGRIESGLWRELRNDSFGESWLVTSKMVGDSLSVSRISYSGPKGGKTLFTLGR